MCSDLAIGTKQIKEHLWGIVWPAVVYGVTAQRKQADKLGTMLRMRIAYAN